jgi:hypothetical protein
MRQGTCRRNISESPYSSRTTEIVTKKHHYVLFDVLRSREVLRAASDVHLALGLVHSDPVDTHLRREREVLDVDLAEAVRDAQVGDDVHRLLRDRAGGDLGDRVGTGGARLHGPSLDTLGEPSDVL